MTFLEEIKEELENLKLKKPCCMLSEIRAMLLFGSVPYEGGLLFGTMSAKCAIRFSGELKRTCAIELPEKVDESAAGYKFFLPKEVLDELCLSCEGEFISETKDCEEKECCRRAFVRGAFLTSGSASDPQRSYRMEIFSENEAAVTKIRDILASFGTQAGLLKRKNNFVVYVNSSDLVSDMLKIMEANSALFRLLDAKVVKDKRNSSNRITNCDLANADRATDTGLRQRRAIEKIQRTVGLQSLKPKLYEAAQLRLGNIDATVSELAEMANPPISKSAMFSRLEKLIEISEKAGDE